MTEQLSAINNNRLMKKKMFPKVLVIVCICPGLILLLGDNDFTTAVCFLNSLFELGAQKWTQYSRRSITFPFELSFSPSYKSFFCCCLTTGLKSISFA